MFAYFPMKKCDFLFSRQDQDTHDQNRFVNFVIYSESDERCVTNSFFIKLTVQPTFRTIDTLDKMKAKKRKKENIWIRSWKTFGTNYTTRLNHFENVDEYEMNPFEFEEKLYKIELRISLWHFYTSMLILEVFQSVQFIRYRSAWRCGRTTMYCSTRYFCITEFQFEIGQCLLNSDTTFFLYFTALQ